MEPRSIDEVIEDHAQAWMSLPGVVGVYRSEDDGGVPVIVIMRRGPMGPARCGNVPKVVEGYRVRYEDASDLRPMGGDDQGK
jgi:hypothetical protein